MHKMIASRITVLATLILALALLPSSAHAGDGGGGKGGKDKCTDFPEKGTFANKELEAVSRCWATINVAQGDQLGILQNFAKTCEDLNKQARAQYGEGLMAQSASWIAQVKASKEAQVAYWGRQKQKASEKTAEKIGDVIRGTQKVGHDATAFPNLLEGVARSLKGGSCAPVKSFANGEGGEALSRFFEAEQDLDKALKTLKGK